MDSLLKTDALMRTRKNPRTGRTERKWIEYADGVFEPVRRDGDLNRKYHGNKRELDRWTVEKPLDWDPLKEGGQVTLNHDYRRPGTDHKPMPGRPSWKDKPGSKGFRRTKDYIPERDHSVPERFAAADKNKPEKNGVTAPKSPGERPGQEQGGEEKKAKPKTTLLRGAEAYREFEAGRKAEKESRTARPPQPTPRGSVKLAGADAAPPRNQGGDDDNPGPAAAGAGAAGGMVKPKGQHGKGKATGSDQRINDFQREYAAADARGKGNLKNQFKKEIDELKAKAKNASGKERKKMLRRAEQWKGALKVITDGKIRPTGPVILFNIPLMKKMLENPFSDPTVQEKI